VRSKESKGGRKKGEEGRDAGTCFNGLKGYKCPCVKSLAFGWHREKSGRCGWANDRRLSLRDQKSANSLAYLSLGRILRSSSSNLSKLLKSPSLFTLGTNGGGTYMHIYICMQWQQPVSGNRIYTAVA